MVDAALLLELGEIATAVVDKGLRYNSTREMLKSTNKDLAPVVQQIEQSMKEMDHPTEEIDKLKEILAANHEVLGKIHVHWWNCCLAPCFQGRLDEEYQSLVRYSSVQVQIHMLRDVKTILSKLTPRDDDDNRRSQAITVQETRDIDITATTTIFKDDDDLGMFPEFTVGLDGPFMNQLKDMLLNGNDQVLNLYGFTGSGKTILAKKLCRDPQVRGKFNNNIIFETLAPQTQSNEAINQLQNRLLQVGTSPILLVLDDVRSSSSSVSRNTIVEQFRVRMSSDSKILVTSRNPIATPATLYAMNPLSVDDAITLLRHSIEPSNIDFNDNQVREILFQIVKDCKRLPMVIELIGRKLREKGIDDLQKLQMEWSRSHSILDPNKDLLTHLQNSMNLLVDDCVRECFKDLALFPPDQKIPVAALIDMWIELYNLDEFGIYAMIFIRKLTSLKLAYGIKVKRIIGRIEDNWYNNHFLMLHNLLTKLAVSLSNEELFEHRKRLIVDMNENRRPEWWPIQQKHPILSRALSDLTNVRIDRKKQYKVAARIISLSTDQNITPDWCNIHAADAVVLVLNLKTTQFTLPEFIQKMRSVKVLVLTNYGFNPTELRNPELLGYLWGLKRIRLQKVSVPCFCELKNVRKLSLHLCEVKNAFEDSSMEFSEAMPNLVELNIEDSKDLVKLPAGLCNIVTMKKLSIRGCPNFIELPEEIGKLENLELLRVSYCTDFNKVPESIANLKKLRLLDISNCVSIRKLPDNIGELRNLRKFYMMGCPISKLPDSVNHMENLENVKCCDYTNPFWQVIKSNRLGLHVSMA